MQNFRGTDMLLAALLSTATQLCVNDCKAIMILKIASYAK